MLKLSTHVFYYLCMTDLETFVSPTRLQALYDRAVETQWVVGDALDWSTILFDNLAPAIRRSMANVYADILYAETFGVVAVERQLALAPAGWQREFAVLQLKDELRHTEFFSRTVNKLGEGKDVPEELATLRSVLEDVSSYEELLLHTQVMETAARVIFVGNGQRTLELLERGIRLPGSRPVAALLKAVVHFVGQDESRHIAVGNYCLRSCLSSLDTAARHAMEDRAADTARLMHSAFARRSEDFRILGMSSADVLARTWSALQAQLGRLEIDIGEPAS
jgi:hypothetical protein